MADMTNRRELADRLELYASEMLLHVGARAVASDLTEAAHHLREPVAGCGCDRVAMGSYDAQVELMPPPHMPRDDGRGICVDACMALEVSSLWRAGITTTGCCCGHNIAPAYIGVIEADIPRMKAMGYEVLPNVVRPGAEDSFKPLKRCHLREPVAGEVEELRAVRDALLNAGGASPSDGMTRFAFWSLDKLAKAFDLAASSIRARLDDEGKGLPEPPKGPIA